MNESDRFSYCYGLFQGREEHDLQDNLFDVSDKFNCLQNTVIYLLIELKDAILRYRAIRKLIILSASLHVQLSANISDSTCF